MARKSRWRITVFGADNEVQDPIGFYAIKASRPKREFDEITVHHGQQEIYLPGKDRWGPIEFTFYEPAGFGFSTTNRIAKFFSDWQKSVSDMTAAVIGGKNATDGPFKRRVEYVMECPSNLGDFGTGQVREKCVEIIWKYQLVNAWPIRVEPGDLDYADGDLADTTVNMRFDRAIENDGK